MFDKDVLTKTVREEIAGKAVYTVPVKDRSGVDTGATINFHIKISGDPPSEIFEPPKNKISTLNWRQVYTMHHEGPIPQLENYIKFSSIKLKSPNNNDGATRTKTKIITKALPSSVKGTSVVKSKSFNGAKLLARLRRESRKRAAFVNRTRQPIATPTTRRATLENYIEFEKSLSSVISRYGLALSNHNNEDLIEKYMRMKYWTQEFNAK